MTYLSITSVMAILGYSLIALTLIWLFYSIFIKLSKLQKKVDSKIQDKVSIPSESGIKFPVMDTKPMGIKWEEIKQDNEIHEKFTRFTTSDLYMEMMKRIPKSTFNRRFKGVESKTLIDDPSNKKRDYRCYW